MFGTGGGRSAFYIYPDDDAAVVILTNLAGGWPEELIDEVAAQYIPGMRLNGVSALRVELRHRGYDHVQKAVDNLKRGDASFQLSELELNDWAYRMLRTGQPEHAVEIFKLAVSLYPNSGNAYDSLAEGYEVTGERALSIKYYKRSLELDPQNTNAVEMLKSFATSPIKKD